ncbi:hypothetical protein HYU07_05305 [Candidatus Woesearchaeota archaeon]|nr:hypothetical protein [Candidatus Woesearchaeota archaeon]
MSKLTVIKKALETNPEVVIVKIFNENYLPGKNVDCEYVGDDVIMCWNHLVDFCVAPKDGLYIKDELQSFMMGLIPKSLKPTFKENFQAYGDKLHFGELCFEEVIGQEKSTRICKVTDEELLNYNGFVNGQQIIKKTLIYQRRTRVRVFPDELVTGDVLEDTLRGELIKPFGYGASLSFGDLMKYVRPPEKYRFKIERVAGIE